MCQIIVKKHTNKYRIKVGDIEKLVPTIGNKSKLNSSLQKFVVVFFTGN